MKLIPSILALFLISFANLSHAESDRVAVVELFTSQGCSSCPPADALMHDLARREDVIGLALHVDYWDYIGWKDEYADPAYSRRQKGYARAGGRKMVYTPQMIINGQDDVVGGRESELLSLIAQHLAVPPVMVASADRQGDMVVVNLQSIDNDPLQGPLDVHLVRYTPLKQAHITRGELAGRDIEYANTVDGWTLLGQWDGQGDAQLRGKLDGTRPAVVLVQRTGYGAILAAVRVQ